MAARLRNNLEKGMLAVVTTTMFGGVCTLLYQTKVLGNNLKIDLRDKSNPDNDPNNFLKWMEDIPNPIEFFSSSNEPTTTTSETSSDTNSNSKTPILHPKRYFNLFGPREDPIVVAAERKAERDKIKRFRQHEKNDVRKSQQNPNNPIYPGNKTRTNDEILSKSLQ